MRSHLKLIGRELSIENSVVIPCSGDEWAGPDTHIHRQMLEHLSNQLLQLVGHQLVVQLTELPGTGQVFSQHPLQLMSNQNETVSLSAAYGRLHQVLVLNPLLDLCQLVLSQAPGSFGHGPRAVSQWVVSHWAVSQWFVSQWGVSQMAVSQVGVAKTGWRGPPASLHQSPGLTIVIPSSASQ